MIKLNTAIAQKIVQRTMKIIGNSVNVMDENGIIIASGNPSRLNQKHTGAILAIRKNEMIEIDAELAEKWNFEAQPGINLPITYLGNTLGAIGISGIPEQVKPYAELVKMTAELIIEQYILLEKERWDRRYKEEFVLQLLRGKLDENNIREQAEFFSLELNTSRIVVIIKLLHPTTDKLQRLVTYLEQFNSKQPLAVLSPDQVILLADTEDMRLLIEHKQLGKLLPSDFHHQDYKIAVGAYTESLLTLQHSYQTAVSTLNYGLKNFPKKSLYFFEEHKLPVLLDNLSYSWQAKKLLAPLQMLYTQDENHTLRKTLKQYFLSNCDLLLTSETLFIHVNTLRYRLNKIERITGLSFNKIDDKFILYLSTVLQY